MSKKVRFSYLLRSKMSILDILLQQNNAEWYLVADASLRELTRPRYLKGYPYTCVNSNDWSRGIAVHFTTLYAQQIVEKN